MKSKLVVGSGDFLDIAFLAWKAKEPEVAVERLEVKQDSNYAFDLEFLDRYSPQDTSMFAAFDNRFLNFKRLELMGAIKGRGFHMEPYLGAGALVAPSAKIGENSFIGDGAVIGAAARLQYNTYIGPRAVVGYAAEIGQSAWIEAAVVLGARTRIGAYSILGAGVSIANNVQVGRLCQIDIPGLYRESIPEKVFYKPPFHGPIRIFN